MSESILRGIKTKTKQKSKKKEQKCLRGKREEGVFGIAAGCTGL